MADGKKRTGTPRLSLSEANTRLAERNTRVRYLTYSGSVEPATVECTTPGCGRTWEVPFAFDAYRKACACRVCHPRKVPERVADRIRLEYPALGVEYLDDINQAHTTRQARHRCVVCGHGTDGSWRVRPASLLCSGSGCPQCALARSQGPQLPPEYVESRLAANNPLVALAGEFKGTNQKSLWRCLADPVHQLFTSRGDAILGGWNGCPTCAKTGFDPSAPGHLYLMVDTEGTRANFGITSDVTRRRKEHERDDGFEYSVVRTHYFERGADAQAAERLLLEQLRAGGYQPLPGSREKFKLPVHEARCYFDLIVALDDRPGT